MKYTNKRILCNLSKITLMLSLIGAQSVYAQSVESISGEVLKDVSSDAIYWEAKVKCSGVESERYILQKADDSIWCSAEHSELCDASKVSVADKVCGDEYAKLEADSVDDEAVDDEVAVTEEESSEEEEEPVVVSQPEPVVEEPVAAEPVFVSKPVIVEPTVAPSPDQVIPTEPINPIVNNSQVTLDDDRKS